MEVGIATVCAAFGVTEKTVKTWIAKENDPLPVNRSGRRGLANKYDLHQCVEWYVRQKVGAIVDSGQGPLDYTAERAKLAKAQRIKIELESEVLRTNLIPRIDVVRLMGRLVSAARSRLRSIPSAFAARAVAMTEAEIDHGLTGAIDGALSGLAVGGGISVEAAAEIDGESVGGFEAATKPRGKRRTGTVEN